MDTKEALEKFYNFEELSTGEMKQLIHELHTRIVALEERT